MTAWPILAQLGFFLVIGMLLGMVYFYALWVTVTRVRTARRPAVLMLTSSALRLGFLFTGLYLIVQGGHWERLLAAVVGIVIARLLTTRVLPAHGQPTEGLH